MNELDIQRMVVGPPLPDGCYLFHDQSPHPAPVYLLDVVGGKPVKRWITCPPTFNRYSFSWKNIKTLSPLTVSAIPSGANIA